MCLFAQAYLAKGKDGYDDFPNARMIADGECSPILPTLVRNHFTTLGVLNKLSKYSKVPWPTHECWCS